jgi:hypothetical protein
MSKSKSIEVDMDELHDINNELYEALHDDDNDTVHKLCTKGIKAYKDMILSVRKNIST